MFFTVYKITNNINGKYYIGKHQTKDLNDGYMGSGKLLKRAFTKYGVENFTKEILHIFETENEMNIKEKELVIISEQTYNLNEGGSGGFSFINRNGMNNKDRTPESHKKRIKKLSEYRKKKCQEEDEKTFMRKLSEKGHETLRQKYPLGIWKGKKHSQETIEKMKASSIGKQSGEKNSQYGTCWMNDGKENKKVMKSDLDKWLQLGYTKGRISPVYSNRQRRET